MQYSFFGRTVASAGLGKLEIISRRASHIFFLWPCYFLTMQNTKKQTSAKVHPNTVDITAQLIRATPPIPSDNKIVILAYGQSGHLPECSSSRKSGLILSANVPRQVSLAGGMGGSNASGAKALGLLFCQQAMCLSGGI